MGADAAPMDPSTAPTATVSSSPTVMDSRTPPAGAGISVSTLSVDTSSSGSSAATVSPTALSQRVTVPSVTLSPRAGMRISVADPAVPVATGAACDGCCRTSSAGVGVGAAEVGAAGVAGSGRGGCWDRRCGRCLVRRADHREGCADGDGLVLADGDGQQDAAGGCGDLGVDLVGGHLQQRLVGGHGVADGLEPAGDRALGDALAQCGHRDGDRHRCCAPSVGPCVRRGRAAACRRGPGAPRPSPRSAWGGRGSRWRRPPGAPPSSR